jgi:tRNA nucleotidyltransferase/poly(A) polymerase
MRQLRTIALLPSEQLLRELLLDCRDAILGTPKLEIWISGGWVRDRLLGLPCSDVDIALSTMTGEQFGAVLTEFFKNDEKYRQRALELGAPSIKFGSFHTTKKNLRKSKKLVTAAGNVFGLGLDWSI